MVRVQTRHARPASAGPARARHDAQLTDTFKRPLNHKVVYEEVTQRKKKLIEEVRRPLRMFFCM